MSVLFSSKNIGGINLANRFVNSATYEAMAHKSGAVSDELIRKYEQLAKGGVGLSITGLMSVEPSGRAYERQVRIDSDGAIDGLTRLVKAVHGAGGKIAFQLVHGGRQTTKEMAGQTPLAPSSKGRDPLNFVKPKSMTVEDIQKIIRAFGAAAQRAAQAGADGVQLHGAHGYLISEFLSPYFNVRSDDWGGSDENRFRFLKEVVEEVKGQVPADFAVLVKINGHDHTPSPGLTPALAATYAGWLHGLGIDGVEVSCGTTNWSYMNMCRGTVPTAELLQSLRWWEKPVGRIVIGRLENKFDLEEGYNLEAAKVIKPALKDTSLLVVGGMRTVSQMEDAIEAGQADFISMSRPFIRDPFLVKKIREGKLQKVSCVSCNRCLAAVANGFPVYCYNKKFPQ